MPSSTIMITVNWDWSAVHQIRHQPAVSVQMAEGALHSHCDYMSPDDFERLYQQATSELLAGYFFVYYPQNPEENFGNFFRNFFQKSQKIA